MKTVTPVLAVPAALAWTIAWFFTTEEPFRRRSGSTISWVADVHSDFIARARLFGGDGGALVPGLVLGNTDAVPESLAEAMRVTSLTHLMAVSGANCAIVVGLVFGLAALCGLPLIARVMASLFALGIFVLVVGPEPSVIRSSLMATVGLGALLWGRPVAGLSAVSVAVLAALAIDPSLSHSIGFALSVAATIGLLVLAPPLAHVLERWIPPRLALVLSLPLSAALACQPIILGFASFIPSYGILANALAEPLVPIATITGLLAIITAPLGPLSDGLLLGSLLVAEAVARIARLFASLPGARIPWPPGAGGVVLSSLVSGGFAAALLTRWRRTGVLIACGGAAFGLSLTLGASGIAWVSAPTSWSWAQCDVGQGDAVLVRDGGQTALIDAGRTEPNLRECLTALRVTHLDLVVLTHFDIDHVGGYGAILGMADVVLHGPTDGIADQAILSTLQKHGASLVAAERGVTGTLGRLDWTVLWPTTRDPREPGNPSSVTVRFTRGPTCDSTCVTGLDLGDLPAAEQGTVRTSGGLVPVDVIKVSHHGSRDQDSDLYRVLHASVALIGVGADNDYGHPTEQTLDLLRGSGSAVLRSDLNGIVLVSRSESGELRVWRERQSEPRFTLNTEE